MARGHAVEQALLLAVALAVVARLRAAGLGSEAVALSAAAAVAAAVALVAPATRVPAARLRCGSPHTHHTTHPPATTPLAALTGRARRRHADSGWLFGCCSLPCLWAAMACCAAEPRRGAPSPP